MSSRASLRAVPVEDRAWLLAALADALDESREGCGPVLPMSPDMPSEAVARLREEQLPEGTALVVRTSGSSGVPKAVALSAEALRASAVATHDALSGVAGAPGGDAEGDDAGGDGGSAPQWLVALPGHLISGIQMLVRSVVAGTDPVFVDGPSDPETLLASAERMHQARRYVSLVPVQLTRLLDLAERDEDAEEALRGFSAVLVGGQSVPLEMRRRAHELGVPLRRSYGMTETAGGCVYDGVEIGDTRVRIRGGEIQLSGSCLALGYVGDAGLTAERFIADSDREGSRSRWYRTGDAGELLGGMLNVTGRLDRVIVSGGVNVSLDEIERIAGEQPGWEGSVAVGMRDPEWGERPVIAVGPVRGSDARAGFSAVREEIRSQLGSAAAPDRHIEVPEIPLLSGGKPDRGALAAIIEGATENTMRSAQ